MPNVTFEFATIVYFRVQGEEQKSEPGDDLPRARDDGGLVGRFLDWQRTFKVHDAVFHSYGGGSLTMGFFPEDAKKVRAWLIEQGAVPQMTFNGWEFAEGQDGHGAKGTHSV